VSHYLFRYHFCLVYRANEKGVVEGLVRYTRQNFLVPVPQVRDFEELNRYLLTMCRGDLRRRVAFACSRNDRNMLLRRRFRAQAAPKRPAENLQAPGDPLPFPA